MSNDSRRTVRFTTPEDAKRFVETYGFGIGMVADPAARGCHAVGC